MNETVALAAAGQSRPQNRYRWLVLIVATVAQASACFLVQGLGALGGYLQESLHLNATQVGLLMSAAQLVPILGLLAAGELLDRYSERLIVGLGGLLVAASLACASMAATYGALLFWLVVVGAAYSTAQPGGSKSVAVWFPRSQRGFAMGIRQAGLPLGGALAAATLPGVALAYGWQTAFMVGALVAGLGGVLFIAVYRSPPAADNGAKKAASLRSAIASRLEVLSQPSMRAIVWSGVTLITGQYAVLIWLTLFLRDRLGVSLETGASLLFGAQMAGVAGRIALAAWSDRAKSGRYYPVRTSMWALAAGIVVLLLAPSFDAPLAAVAAIAVWLGFFGFGWYGPWVAYVSEAAPPDKTGFALGAAMAINQLAIVGAPPFLGLLADWSGGYAATWLFVVGILVLALVMTSAPRRMSRPVCGEH